MYIMYQLYLYRNIPDTLTEIWYFGPEEQLNRGISSFAVYRNNCLFFVFFKRNYVGQQSCDIRQDGRTPWPGVPWCPASRYDIYTIFYYSCLAIQQETDEKTYLTFCCELLIGFFLSPKNCNIFVLFDWFSFSSYC